mmetsp:Transcript_34103/g.104774  ORF Transcript_34103/g.104774 Transcript_34103/m.104774 type:complete len:283 (+) Transcript_34103:223-1071(+)
MPSGLAFSRSSTPRSCGAASFGGPSKPEDNFREAALGVTVRSRRRPVLGDAAAPRPRSGAKPDVGETLGHQAHRLQADPRDHGHSGLRDPLRPAFSLLPVRRVQDRFRRDARGVSAVVGAHPREHVSCSDGAPASVLDSCGRYDAGICVGHRDGRALPHHALRRQDAHVHARPLDRRPRSARPGQRPLADVHAQDADAGRAPGILRPDPVHAGAAVQDPPRYDAGVQALHARGGRPHDAVRVALLADAALRDPNLLLVAARVGRIRSRDAEAAPSLLVSGPS